MQNMLDLLNAPAFKTSKTYQKLEKGQFYYDETIDKFVFKEGNNYVFIPSKVDVEAVAPSWNSLTGVPDALKNGTYSLSSHTHSEYALTSHSHDYSLVFAPIAHNHDSAYATVSHTHNNYALTTHNHDTVYALTAHTHSNYSLTTHNHNTLYAALSHNHDTAYAALNHTHTGFATDTHTHATLYAPISHTHDYAATNHNHDSTYATIGHTHSGFAASDHNHSTLYAPLTHTHDYAASNHNHSTLYAPLSHTHDYAASNHTHTGFATDTHTHNDYALTTHSHDYSSTFASLYHSHEGVYATTFHTHDTLYASKNSNNCAVVNGVVFPATMVGYADANTLDDYEEGSWTPVLRCTTVAGTIPVNSASTYGRYVKIGQMVYLSCQFAWNSYTAGDASGTLLIQGIPFVVGATGTAAVLYSGLTWTTAHTEITCQIGTGTATNPNSITFWLTGKGIAPVALTHTNLLVANAGYIILGLTYRST